jgi:large subunit ribosomal protein L17
MNKRKKGRKFNREKSQRKALLIGLASNLFLKEKIKTTLAKAKELSAFSEKYITKAREMDLTKKRLLLRYLSPRVVAKLEKEIAPRYKTRPGGYTRIIKLGRRTKSDGAKMAIIELIK